METLQWLNETDDDNDYLNAYKIDPVNVIIQGKFVSNEFFEVFSPVFFVENRQTNANNTYIIVDCSTKSNGTIINDNQRYSTNVLLFSY